MQGFLQDNEFATELKSTGKYNSSPKRRKLFSVQEHLIAETKEQIAKQVEASLRRTSGKANDQGEGNQKNP
jgi:chromatin remodeling complex protein RSC6